MQVELDAAIASDAKMQLAIPRFSRKKPEFSSFTLRMAAIDCYVESINSSDFVA